MTQKKRPTPRGFRECIASPFTSLVARAGRTIEENGALALHPKGFVASPSTFAGGWAVRTRLAVLTTHVQQLRSVLSSSSLGSGQFEAIFSSPRCQFCGVSCTYDYPEGGL